MTLVVSSKFDEQPTNLSGQDDDPFVKYDRFVSYMPKYGPGRNIRAAFQVVGITARYIWKYHNKSLYVTTGIVNLGIGSLFSKGPRFTTSGFNQKRTRQARRFGGSRNHSRGVGTKCCQPCTC